MAGVDVDLDEVDRFMGLVQGGATGLHAALGVGWTPLKFRKLMKDPDFAELYQAAEDGFLDGVESKVGELALAGTRWASELVLFNRRPDRWRPPAQRISVEQNSTVKHEVVLATTAAARELLREPGAVAALQRAVIDVDARDD